MSTKQYSIIILFAIFSMACIAPMAVAAVSDSQDTASTKSVFSPEDVTAQLQTAEMKCKLVSVTYWQNGVKHTLDLSVPNPVIYNLKGSANVITISFKSSYNGPAGTSGMAYLWNDDFDYTVWANMIPAGKTKTTNVNIPLYFTNPGTYNYQVGIISPGSSRFSLKDFDIIVS